MGQWLEHTVFSEITAPVEQVWQVWSDLEAMPLWMTWIESVKTIENETTTLPDLTEWTLAANGFRFKWQAKINERIDKQKLEWSSIGGLPTKGSVRFYEEKENFTIVKLIISYELPKALARFMKEDILGKLVTNELQNNLDNFKELVESGHGKL
ncbi:MULTISPECIES: SRPBCC family protein [Prochlorococcus]|uniref:Oligoketide cyclase/lipid transport-like protein n=1 Tax=Prochlorococcus marinus (strain SARG / CCMP1375 / SS120) TaxID=167539 RepID=Q7VE78_PROMA|nr:MULTISPECIES: SRPBCC family protein [Prochlorococcus]AAP99181.1 Oligoketide cyclase/lipid transport-like protein [Prochlorococcus marinus subsp. marinus str. CCMP1375]KGG11550.1 Oligoketide cyclase/lipid transport protein [Prochlorococcus marinus str. LG]KGG18496.1 Oligoketide cyclase/lipid transport protein [Prochlorococcus marinus str. SS2]KGG22769.1 Oligoketide cyclase/lipid transport protein [Prochlorococcus marinus str. SS35]KGG32646.1 Oligoketide cyclase/lipid transport protein [Proch